MHSYGNCIPLLVGRGSEPRPMSLMRSMLICEGLVFAGKIEGLTERDAELFFYRLTERRRVAGK